MTARSPNSAASWQIKAESAALLAPEWVLYLTLLRVQWEHGGGGGERRENWLAEKWVKIGQILEPKSGPENLRFFRSDQIWKSEIFWIQGKVWPFVFKLFHFCEKSGARIQKFKFLNFLKFGGGQKLGNFWLKIFRKSGFSGIWEKSGFSENWKFRAIFATDFAEIFWNA